MSIQTVNVTGSQIKRGHTWSVFLLIFVLNCIGARGQVADECWSGTWSGTYSFQTEDSCALTDSGGITLTLSVDAGVVTGSGAEDGISCYDTNTCTVTGSGTFSGSLSGTTSGDSISLRACFENGSPSIISKLLMLYNMALLS
jgi:hypothetical protein